MPRSVAIVCARNEAVHISRCLRDLIAEGLDVVLIDNGSTDDTVGKAQRFLGRGLLGIERLAWRGVFALAETLEAKIRIAQLLPHDWVFHFDADEWPTATQQGETLAQAVERADSAGANCINFDEFVFMPSNGQDFCHERYSACMTSYYFFQPDYPRLMRGWRRDAGLSNLSSGGHQLEGGELRRHPVDLVLRHYMVLSLGQATEKYLSRTFAPDELQRGWHGNRTRISEENIRLPDAGRLQHLPHPLSKAFSKANPQDRHYWEWPPAPAS